MRFGIPCVDVTMCSIKPKNLIYLLSYVCLQCWFSWALGRYFVTFTQHCRSLIMSSYWKMFLKCHYYLHRLKYEESGANQTHQINVFVFVLFFLIWEGKNEVPKQKSARAELITKNYLESGVEWGTKFWFWWINDNYHCYYFVINTYWINTLFSLFLTRHLDQLLMWLRK